MKLKKTLSVALAAVMTICMLAGCDQGEPSATVTVSPSGGVPATGGTRSLDPEQETVAGTTAPADAIPGATVIPEEYMEEISTLEPVANPDKKIGVLSLLRMDEESYTKYRLSQARMYLFLIARGLAHTPDGTIQGMRESGMATPVYFDTLDSMIMGLESGQLDNIALSQSIAKYVVSRNDRLQMGIETDIEKADDFDKFIIDSISQGYSFMMLEDRTALCDEFNSAIENMKFDGTLDKLKKEYIDDVIVGKDPEPVTFDRNEGETIRVAVTGSLPPMDFVAPDGTPAGFNTAILAEIGRRLGKNIELLQVDSLGRAAALASGFVDVVFWTRGRARPEMGNSQVEVDSYVENVVKANLTKQQLRVFNAVTEQLNTIPVDDMFKRDMPDGTVCTQPYFIDMGSMVILKQ